MFTGQPPQQQQQQPSLQQQQQTSLQQQQAPPSQQQLVHVESYQNYGASSPDEQQPAKKFRASDDQRTYNRNYAATPQEDYTRKNGTDYGNQYAEQNNSSDELNNSTSTACAIASSLNSVYSGDEDGSEDFAAYGSTYNNDAAINAETTKYTEDTLTYTNASAPTADLSSLPGGCILPQNFAQYSKNHYEPWNWPIFLDEPDTNKICKYPRHLVYPGNGSEYSLEEIRARNYTKVIELIKERNRQREIYNEQRQINQIQRRQTYENNVHQMTVQQQHMQQHQVHHQQQQQPHVQQQPQLPQQPQQQQHHQQQQHMQQQHQYAEQQALERQRLAEIERERQLQERERSRLAALEMQRAKEQEEQKRRMAEQQKMQQMQEHSSYVHQVIHFSLKFNKICIDYFLYFCSNQRHHHQIDVIPKQVHIIFQ